MIRDFVINTIINNIEKFLKDGFEYVKSDEKEFENRLAGWDKKQAEDLIIRVIKSQGLSVRHCFLHKRNISLPGIGSFKIKFHDRLIYNLMVEEANKLGYDDLKALKGTEILKGIKKRVDKLRKPILQDFYHKRRTVVKCGNPQPIPFDFMEGLQTTTEEPIEK